MRATTIPERIQIAKTALGIVTAVEFADSCGMSGSVVNQLKTGRMKSFAARYAYQLEDNRGICARWMQLGEEPMKVGSNLKQKTNAIIQNPDIQKVVRCMEVMTPQKRKVVARMIVLFSGVRK